MKVYIPALLLILPFTGTFYPTTTSLGLAAQQDSVLNKKGDKPVAMNVIFKSVDGGDTWQDMSPRQISTVTNNTSSDSVQTEMPVFYQGSQSPLNENGVASWPAVAASFPRKDMRTVVETASGVAIIGCDGGLFKSTNNGTTWKQVYSRGGVMKIVESGGIMMAASPSGIIRSTDDGEHWEDVLSEGGVGIDIQNIKGGFASITYNTTSRTRRVRTSYDEGESWQPVDAGLPASEFIASITEVGKYLFCCHPAGVFRSGDKGKTWKLLLPAVDGKVFNLSVSDNVIYALAKEGGC